MTATQQVPEGHTVHIKTVERVEHVDPPYLKHYNYHTRCQRHGCSANAEFLIWFDAYGIYRCCEHTDGYIHTKGNRRVCKFTMTTIPPEVIANSKYN